MAIDRQLLAASWRAWFSAEGATVGPWWLQWLWTLAVGALIAVGFTVYGFVAHASGEGAWRNWAGWVHWYGINLVISLSVSVTIKLLFVIVLPLVGSARIKRLGAVARVLFFSAVPLLGVAIGGPIGLWLTGQQGLVWIDTRDANSIAASVLMSVLVSTIFFLVFNAKARQLEAERRASEAQLRLLQGQIEPHFLFNTLANVQALIDHDPAKAKAMLESFTDYLRSSLGALRQGSGTLGAELDLVQAYLGLLKTRMEDRLQFSLVSDPALRGLPLPALLLQPLVENAIHHGLEPKVSGGSVHVSAHTEPGMLVLQVQDDGLGLAAPPRRRKGHGVALANLRERLLAQYGSRARLELHDAAPGTRATLHIPIENPT